MVGPNNYTYIDIIIYGLLSIYTNIIQLYYYYIVMLYPKHFLRRYLDPMGLEYSYILCYYTYTIYIWILVLAQHVPRCSPCSTRPVSRWARPTRRCSCGRTRPSPLPGRHRSGRDMDIDGEYMGLNILLIYGYYMVKFTVDRWL